MPVLLVTVIATAIGGLLARDAYENPAADVPDPVLPTETSVPPEKQPGSGVVQGTPDATAHPLFENLRAVLQTYFDAINRKDYETWTRTVTDDRLEIQPKETWLENFRSTTDGNIVIYRIELAEEGAARVLMKFTSVQHPSDAPPELRVPCIHWNVVLPLVPEESGWKIDSGPTSASPQHEPCD